MHAFPSPATASPSHLTASIHEVSAASMLEAMGRSSLSDDGQALMVSVEAIKTALGPRWAPRRNQVYEVVQRHFRKYLSPTDVWQPASETYFLVVTPNTPPMVAQALCYRALKEVLTFFLGEVNPLHLEVSRVTGISNDRIEMQPCTVAQLEKADLDAVATQTSAAAPSSLSSLTSWPLTTADGQNLRVSFAVEPVLDLRAWLMAGHRIESRIMDLQTGFDLTGIERRLLLPRDFEKIDLAALERGMSRLRGAEMPENANLIIQLSFASLSNSRARSALLKQARDMQAALRQAAICELVDFEAGLPVGRLVEVASLVRGFFRGVFVQVEPKRIAVETALSANVFGLSVRAADLGRDSNSITAAANDFVKLLKGRRTFLTATSLPSPDLLVAVLAAGFTHATLRASPPAP